MEKLFVLAHPDDELLFAHALTTHKDTARVLMATHGTRSTVDRIGNNFVRSGQRRTESYAALRSLGLAPQQMHFGTLREGRLQDGRLTHQLGQLTFKILEITRKHPVDTIYSFDRTPPEQIGTGKFLDHMDHEATYDASRIAIAALAGRRAVAHHVLTAQSQSADILYSGSDMHKTTVIQSHASQFEPNDQAYLRWLETEYAEGWTEHFRIEPAPLTPSYLLEPATTANREYVPAA